MAIVVEREDIFVLCAGGGDDPPGIRASWDRLESIVPLRGRKFFGLVEEVGASYFACVARVDGDDPEALGLEERILPGGRYLRERLRGEPPAVYEQIASTVKALEEQAHLDESRAVIEYYRRRDEVDILVPIV